MQAVIGQKLIGSLKPDIKPYEVRDTRTRGFILRVQPSGIMSYICEYSRGKRITYGRVGQITPAQARERAQDILADVIKGADPQAAKKAAKAHTLESYIIEVYAPWVEIHQRSAATTISRMKANFLPILGKYKLADITPWNVEKWRSQRLKAGIKPSSLNRYVATLKAALSRAVDWGYISENPLLKVKPLRLDKTSLVRFLDDDEEERLRTALDVREHRISAERDTANSWRAERGYELLPEMSGDHLKPMVILSLNTGLRRGELFSLQWTNIDLDRAMLTVKGMAAKSGQTRHVPLNAEALDTLTQWQAQSNSGNKLVFTSKNGGCFDNVNNSWGKLLRDAKITNFRWHDIRHHFASRLVMAGVDLNTVRELLGHADTKMTLRYAHLAPRIKAEAVEKLIRSGACQSQITMS